MPFPPSHHFQTSCGVKISPIQPCKVSLLGWHQLRALSSEPGPEPPAREARAPTTCHSRCWAISLSTLLPCLPQATGPQPAYPMGHNGLQLMVPNPVAKGGIHGLDTEIPSCPLDGITFPTTADTSMRPGAPWQPVQMFITSSTWRKRHCRGPGAGAPQHPWDRLNPATDNRAR